MKHAKYVGKARVLVQTKMHECKSKCASEVCAARALLVQIKMRK